ncbi:hypothetical protein [Microbulbifer agarilyticus]|uniref:hypothetical protein n=1 Tax=Microbulbifer agarilyticus TaxID=260552 RepID=UPI001CD3D3CC|nr:hypothetical protein [Microbulbifer agarilyticus]MCA0895115.1 hypothetical protein [Microbulbifer agarilyticus]
MKPNYGAYIPGTALAVTPTLGALLVSTEKYPVFEFGIIFFAIILSISLGKMLRIVELKIPLIIGLVTMVAVFKFFEGKIPIDLFGGRVEITRKTLAIFAAFIPLVSVDLYWRVKSGVET